MLRRSFPLVAICLGYLVIGALFAIETPAWQAPDEPAHYNVIRQLAEGKLPVIEPDDYDEQYRAAAVSAGFGPNYPIEPLTYEDWQPPLYYLLLTPIFLAFNGALLPLRLTSLLFGLGVLLATYAIGRQLWPDARWKALTATIFVAFLPQHIAILSSVNNDSLAGLIIALLLWSLSTLISTRNREMYITPARWSTVGLLLGLGLITKLTVYIMVPVVVLVIVQLYWPRRREMVQVLGRVVTPAFFLGALLWVRNMVVYGPVDPLGMLAHDAVVQGQPRTVEWFATYGVMPTLQRFAVTTFRSFWGQFGWMGVLMDSRIYQILFFFSTAIVVALFWRLLTGNDGNDNETRDEHRARLRRILAVMFGLNVLLYLTYNISYVQHQGRYLFAAILPIGLAVASGIAVWAGPLIKRWPMLAVLVPALFAAALMALDLLALYGFIVPQLTT